MKIYGKLVVILLGTMLFGGTAQAERKDQESQQIYEKTFTSDYNARSSRLISCTSAKREAENFTNRVKERLVHTSDCNCENSNAREGWADSWTCMTTATIEKKEK